MNMLEALINKVVGTIMQEDAAWQQLELTAEDLGIDPDDCERITHNENPVLRVHRDGEITLITGSEDEEELEWIAATFGSSPVEDDAEYDAFALFIRMGEADRRRVVRGSNCQ